MADLKPEDTAYPIPENAQYDPTIRKLKVSDPAQAETVFNPLFQQIINNTHALKLSDDTKAQKDLSNVTASSILEKVKVVDGSGSGLDADTVDGKHASDFKLALKNGNYFLSNFGDTGITLGNGDNATFEACNMDIQSWYGIGIKPAAPSSSDIGRTIVINARNGDIKTKGQIYVDTNKKIWHEGNDGSGSGLDADTVDGKHAAVLYSNCSAAAPTSYLGDNVQYQV